MNLNQTFSILFWLHKSKQNNKGLVPIWMRITIDGKRAECSTSRQISIAHWDNEKGEAFKTCPESKLINEYLVNVRAEINRHYNILLTTKEYVSAEDVKLSFKGIKEKKYTFLDTYRKFLKIQIDKKNKGELSESRIKRFNTIYDKCQNL